MDSNELQELLENVKNGTVDIEHAFKEIKQLPYEDLGFAKIDHHRSIRNGYPRLFTVKARLPIRLQKLLKS
jgi:NCAIR mutase (PurE)-related protein